MTKERGLDGDLFIFICRSAQPGRHAGRLQLLPHSQPGAEQGQHGKLGDQAWGVARNCPSKRMKRLFFIFSLLTNQQNLVFYYFLCTGNSLAVRSDAPQTVLRVFTGSRFESGMTDLDSGSRDTDHLTTTPPTRLPHLLLDYHTQCCGAEPFLPGSGCKSS